MLPGPHRRPLGHCCPLEEACLQLKALVLISKVLTFTVQDVLCLRQGLMSRAHGFTHGDVARRIWGGKPQDHLHGLLVGHHHDLDHQRHRPDCRA
jgi:hypothetical protein